MDMTDTNSTSPADVLSQYNYAIIDPIQMAYSVQRGDFDQLLLAALVPEGFEADSPKLPLLVDLEILDDDARQHWWQLLEQARQQHEPPVFGALLKGPRGRQARLAMHNHLSKQLIQRNRQLNQRFLLRYYDPRVFAHLQWILHSYQLALLFGPIEKWSYIHQGIWHHIDVPTPETGHTLQSLIITSLQWQQLDYTADINDVLGKTAELEPSKMTGVCAIDALHAFELMARAVEVHGLHEPEARKSFALHGMTSSSIFDTHPIMREIFSRLKADPEAVYQYETATLTPEQWHDIKTNQGFRSLF